MSKKIVVISLRLVEKELLELDNLVQQFNYQDRSKLIRFCIFGKKHKDQKSLLFQSAVLMIHAQLIEVSNASNGLDKTRWSSLMEKLEKLIDDHNGI